MYGKIAIIGDLHFGIKKADPSFLDYQKEYLDNEFFPLLEEKNIRTIIQTGDILDSRTHIDFLVARFLNSYFFEQIIKRDLMFYSVLGNHDIYYRQSTKLSGIDEMACMQDRIMIVDTHFSRKFGNCWIDFVPWICNENIDVIVERMKESIAKEGYKLCIGHFELENFEMQKGITCSKSTFDINLLKKYDKVISGHFHTPSDQGNITYIGSPYQLTWSDVNDAKKIIIFDPDRIEYEEIPTKSKRYFIFDFNSLREKTFDFEQCRHGYIKIVLADSKVSNAVIDKTLSKLEAKSEPKQVQVLDQRDSENSQTVQEVNLESVNTPYTAIQNTIKNSILNDRIKKLSQDYVYKFCKELDAC